MSWIPGDRAEPGGAVAPVETRNVRDFRSAELKFRGLRILTPRLFLKEYPCQP